MPNDLNRTGKELQRRRPQNRSLFVAWERKWGTKTIGECGDRRPRSFANIYLQAAVDRVGSIRKNHKYRVRIHLERILKLNSSVRELNKRVDSPLSNRRSPALPSSFSPICELAHCHSAVPVAVAARLIDGLHDKQRDGHSVQCKAGG